MLASAATAMSMRPVRARRRALSALASRSRATSADSSSVARSTSAFVRLPAAELDDAMVVRLLPTSPPDVDLAADG